MVNPSLLNSNNYLTLTLGKVPTLTVKAQKSIKSITYLLQNYVF